VAKHKLQTLLIFGYPLTAEYLGGLIWIRKVVDYLEKKKDFNIRKVNNTRISQDHKFSYLYDIHALFKGIFCNANIAILDTYGEAAIWMWILLRLFRHRTKVVTVFHHYEPLAVRHKGCGRFRMKYYYVVDSVTKIMLQDSDRIITVSKSSINQLETVFQIRDTKKIVNVGCSSVDYYIVNSNGDKDIDFLCVGRFEKFDGIEKIWNIIKEKSPRSQFVMIGRGTSEEKIRLKKIGIEHLGVVSDSEKLLLYGRAKVFIFPSLFEGFGMAITEALSAGLSTVAWSIPVFEERFRDESLNNGILVPLGNYELFGEKAVRVLNEYNDWFKQPHGRSQKFFTKSWEDVGNLVVSALRFQPHTN
jgi:glycosyltransferase involved in cell wall biosynthesis